jgi:hypothetical protein
MVILLLWPEKKINESPDIEETAYGVTFYLDSISSCFNQSMYSIRPFQRLHQ